jgi:hypothetical protein
LGFIVLTSEQDNQGADRVIEGKPNQAVSVKISSREAEHKENSGWLADLEPKAETLASELALANQELLEALRCHIKPHHLEVEAQMNHLLLAASRLRHSWHKAVAKAINQVADAPLTSDLSAINMHYRLKVD